MRTTATISIYDNSGLEAIRIPVTKECVREETMNGDFVRLSWNDVEYVELQAGWYIEPLPSVGTPARYMLLKPYRPERGNGFYRYQPEFQNPVMWLGSVPYRQDTTDASGSPVERTEIPYVGRLDELLNDLLAFVNGSFELTGAGAFQLYTISIDTSQTISVTLKDLDVLSAIAEVARVCGAEWRLDWESKYFYFGSIQLGVTPYDLTVDENIGLPSVSRSSDSYYNAYLVHGSSRNNTRRTDHGNIPVSDPLLLDESEYPGSIIDKREDNGEPLLTKVLNVESVYPTYELYMGNLVERRKYKLDEDGLVTSERYSIWYLQLAKYYEQQGVPHFERFNLIDFVGFTVREKRVETHEIYLGVSFDRTYFCHEEEQDGYPVTLLLNNIGYPVWIYEGDVGEMAFDPGALFDSISYGDDLRFSEGFVMETLPAENVRKYSVDGLVPTIAMLINTESGAMPSSLGTREFEVEYHDRPVEFNGIDDVRHPSGEPEEGYYGFVLDAGYFEIIYKEEGSDKLIVPTTSEQGIIPRGYDGFSTLANKCNMYNVSVDAFGGTAKSEAQRRLADEAERLIAEERVDTNNYTFHGNCVKFEAGNPNLYIGRRVRFNCDNTELTTRVLKLVTHLDYSFDQEITVGNSLVKGARQRMQDELSDLQNKFDNWSTAYASGSVDVVNTIDDIVVRYMEWTPGKLYYYETRNRETGKIETSWVFHRGCWWMCLRSFTPDEPWFTSSDWKCMSVVSIALQFFTAGDSPQPLTVVPVRPGGIDFRVMPYLLLGNEDITADSIDNSGGDGWTWTRESFDTEGDAVWNQFAKARQRELRVTDTITPTDVPQGWKRGLKLEFVCTAKLKFDIGDGNTIYNRVTF